MCAVWCGVWTGLLGVLSGAGAACPEGLAVATVVSHRLQQADGRIDRGTGDSGLTGALTQALLTNGVRPTPAETGRQTVALARRDAKARGRPLLLLLSIDARADEVRLPYETVRTPVRSVHGTIRLEARATADEAVVASQSRTVRQLGLTVRDTMVAVLDAALADLVPSVLATACRTLSIPIRPAIETATRPPHTRDTARARHDTTWHFPASADGTERTAVPWIAVVIGNQRYGTGIPPVETAYADAKGMRAFLRDGLGVADDDILFEQDASKGTMEGLLEARLPNYVRSIDGPVNVLVYFSGHGLPTPEAQADAMLLPSDARPDTVTASGYRRDRLLTQLSRLSRYGARHILVILDACFSGATKQGTALSPSKPFGITVREATPPPNVLVFSAADAEQIAWADPASGYSLFTFHLLAGLTGKADADGDRRITLRELSRYTGDQVRRASLRRFGSEQTPHLDGPWQSQTLVIQAW